MLISGRRVTSLRGVRHGPIWRTRFQLSRDFRFHSTDFTCDFRISSGFQDFTRDFMISSVISGFHLRFRDFTCDFRIAPAIWGFCSRFWIIVMIEVVSAKRYARLSKSQHLPARFCKSLSKSWLPREAISSNRPQY